MSFGASPNTNVSNYYSMRSSAAAELQPAPRMLFEEAVPISQLSARSHNPLRSYVESMRRPPGEVHAKQQIPLSLGDPTLFGNFNCPPLLDSLVQSCAA